MKKRFIKIFLPIVLLPLIIFAAMKFPFTKGTSISRNQLEISGKLTIAPELMKFVSSGTMGLLICARFGKVNSDKTYTYSTIDLKFVENPVFPHPFEIKGDLEGKHGRLLLQAIYGDHKLVHASVAQDPSPCIRARAGLFRVLSSQMINLPGKLSFDVALNTFFPEKAPARDPANPILLSGQINLDKPINSKGLVLAFLKDVPMIVERPTPLLSVIPISGRKSQFTVKKK